MEKYEGMRHFVAQVKLVNDKKRYLFEINISDVATQDECHEAIHQRGLRRASNYRAMGLWPFDEKVQIWYAELDGDRRVMGRDWHALEGEA